MGVLKQVLSMARRLWSCGLRITESYRHGHVVEYKLLVEKIMLFVLPHLLMMVRNNNIEA